MLGVSLADIGLRIMDQSLLYRWGWDSRYQEVFENSRGSFPDTVAGRVLSQREDTFSVVTAEGLVYAHPAGVLFHQRSSEERPGVGDWVLLSPMDCEISDQEESTSVTHSVVDVLPRRSCFLREAPGGRGEAQVVATNVDQIFIVNAADDVNLNRIERFAVAVCAGGAKPAVILSKGDLVSESELDKAREAVAELMPGLRVLSVFRVARGTAAVTRELESALIPGQTFALVGASGVGKSTLINALMKESVQETGEVREGDHKGRHVTSFRELFPLPGGALVMDTPGVREFALWADGDGLCHVFSDLEELAQTCRFADCSHGVEPGCAVRGAVLEKKLSERRVENWKSLAQELEESRERRERREARQERARFRRKVKRDERFSRS